MSDYTLSNFPSVALTETKISFLFPECVSVNIGDINSWGRQWPFINLAEYLKRVFGQESKSTKENERVGGKKVAQVAPQFDQSSESYLYTWKITNWNQGISGSLSSPGRGSSAYFPPGKEKVWDRRQGGIRKSCKVKVMYDHSRGNTSEGCKIHTEGSNRNFSNHFRWRSLQIDILIKIVIVCLAYSCIFSFYFSVL